MSVLYHRATGKGRFFRFVIDKQSAIASGEYVVQKPPVRCVPRTGGARANPDAARLAEMAAYAAIWRGAVG